ncbi:putative sensor domain DACNV-containing protein [Sorangium sp. So ce296]|uniref:putative sensor domain DACNV-containing protein n=1 Tax=Sorangium sp. So ce296 TaxID=3133296 RepID=UPI003F615D54
MNSDAEIVEQACARIPAGASNLTGWARDVLDALVPIVMQASLTREESNYIQFSLAIVQFPAEYAWDGYLFDGSVECTPSSLLKLAGLTTAGETYLIARKFKNRMFVVGVGRPQSFFGVRMDHDIASRMTAHEYAFVAATVLGPGTVLLEGFSTELAFLFEGQLQPVADVIQGDSVRFINNYLKSKNVLLKYEGFPPAPIEALRPIAGLRVIERIIRGAWFAGRGGLLAFSVIRGRWPRSAAPAAYWLTKTVSLLDLSLDVIVAQNERITSQTAGSILDLLNTERVFDQNVSNAVRASTLDGAVLFDNGMRLCAFGAKLRPPPLKDLMIRHASGGPPLNLKTKGTRHLSAASWVAAGRSRMAIVISQDRLVRIFERDADGRLVYVSVRPRLFD